MGDDDASAAGGARRRLPWRRWLRAVHRDVGYFAVGLTLVYAISGIAVNHIAEWDPSFENFRESHQLDPAALVGTDLQIVANALAGLGITARPDDIYRVSDERVDAIFADHTVHIQTRTGVVTDEGRRGRPLLRSLNWLHLNRGKAAWTIFADAFAVMLVFLALSGLFMIRGRRGVLGWRAIYVVAGAALPIGYLWLSGGA